jgi:alpha-glucuronidase
LLVCAAGAHAEDGYDLWLRYRAIEGSWAIRYRSFSTEVVARRARILPHKNCCVE